ncbi:MAG: DUF4229 domain-containing protein [Nocardioidaceae bacterium]
MVVKIFALYTMARLVLFAGVYGLIWLVLWHWVSWDVINAFATALAAMVISSVAALLFLRGMRDDLARKVAERADRAKAAYEARRAAEDDDAEADSDHV